MTVACKPLTRNQLNPVTPTHSVPELLSPAGDLECLRAAVENGADAVYFGLQGHNARRERRTLMSIRFRR